jgi:hypothetical protein
MCWQRFFIVLVIILALNNSQMRKLKKEKKGHNIFVEKLEILVFLTIFKGMNALATILPMFITK